MLLPREVFQVNEQETQRPFGDERSWISSPMYLLAVSFFFVLKLPVQRLCSWSYWVHGPLFLICKSKYSIKGTSFHLSFVLHFKNSWPFVFVLWLFLLCRNFNIFLVVKFIISELGFSPRKHFPIEIIF